MPVVVVAAGQPAAQVVLVVAEMAAPRPLDRKVLTMVTMAQPIPEAVVVVKRHVLIPLGRSQAALAAPA
jgi:hypothetical protein